MEIPKLLEETIQRQRQLVDQINTLDQQRQQLLQEALKLEGEVRLLRRLNGDDNRGAVEGVGRTAETDSTSDNP